MNSGFRKINDLVSESLEAYGVSTGMVDGGILSIGTPTSTFSISDGFGFVTDPVTVPTSPNNYKVTWSGLTNLTVTNLATSILTFVSIDVNGDVIQQTSRWTSEQYRNRLIIGVLVHPDNLTISNIDQETVSLFNPLYSLVDLAVSIGFINVSGNLITANGANEKLNKSAGKVFYMGSNWSVNKFAPNVRDLPALTAPTFEYRLQDSTSYLLTDSLESETYDLNGAATSVPNNKWTVQRVYTFIDGNIKVQPGQFIYNTMDEARLAIETENFVTEPSIEANGLLRCYIIIKEPATDLTNPTQACFIQANKFGI